MASEGGIEILQGRLERRKRVVPPPRRPVLPEAGADGVETATPGSDAASSPMPPERPAAVPAGAAGRSPNAPPTSAAEGKAGPGSPKRARARGATPASTSSVSDGVMPAPDEPFANLAVRVRRSFDDLLADLVHDLRRGGVRTSKAELVEVALAGLPSSATEALVDRLMKLRSVAPRRV